MPHARRPSAGHGASVWSRGGTLVNEHLEQLERNLDTLADGGAGWVTSEDECARAPSPYQLRKRFFGQVVLEIKFERVGAQIRYGAHLDGDRPTRREGPAGTIGLERGPAAAEREVEKAFARIAAFIDSCELVLRRQDPGHLSGPIGMFKERWQSLRDELGARPRR